MKTWQTWLNGVVGGFIGAAANALTLLIVDPLKFSPYADGGLKNLAISTVISGAVGAALYLKQHPTPFDPTLPSITPSPKV